MDDNWVLPFEIEDSHFEEAPVASRSQKHRDLVHVERSQWVADRVQHVLVWYGVFAGWLSNSHLDKIACLIRVVNDRCLAAARSPSPSRRRVDDRIRRSGRKRRAIAKATK